jgi:predicted metal-dependent hydrolase
MFTRLGCEGRPPRFRVEYFPYSSLVLTIRRREDAVVVRLSDLLSRATRPVLEGAAALLLARLYRRKAPASVVAAYLEYARSGRTRGRLHRMRRERVKARAESPRGRIFDLDAIFERLNREYFSGALKPARLGWSTRAWRRQFGCYDPGPNQILLNRRLDRSGVPACAVQYVLFHEMLHLKHPTRRSGCSLVSHSREFREEEKQFRGYKRARRFLDRR